MISSDPELESTSASSRREWIPSLLNTLRRCHSTVRGLRNSRAPISGFDSPSRASPAICRSCASQIIARLHGPLAHLLAGRRQLAARALGERLHPDRSELSCAARSCTRASTPALLAAQPLAIEQMRAGELRTQPGARQSLDRLAVQALGALTLADECAAAGFDAQCPIGAGRRCDRHHALERGGRELGASQCESAASISSGRAQWGDDSCGVSSAARSAAASARS